MIVEGVIFLVALLLSWYLQLDIYLLPKGIFGEVITGTILTVPPLLAFMLLLSPRSDNYGMFKSLKRIVNDSLVPLFKPLKYPDLVFISMLAGIAEELLFRGVLQAKIGLVASSVLFGLAHFVSFGYFIAATFMGLYIGASYLYSGSLFVPVYIHFLYDLAALVYLKKYIGNRTVYDRL